MKLQDHFVKSVRFYFKEEGAAWLRSLPELLHYCEQKWSIKMKEPYNLSINYVAPAVNKDGAEVVVKMCLPGTEFLDELETLQLFQTNGMVQVIDYEEDKGIIILEKLSPGDTLAELKDDESACRVAAEVIRKLSRPAPIGCRIQTTKTRENQLKNIANNHKKGLGPITQKMFEIASEIFASLNQTIGEEKLLHGDFHHYNILNSGGREWKVIDPKGLIGEIEYDLIQFLLNCLPDEGTFEVTENRIEILTNELNLNKERLILWGYSHSVLATSWTVEEEEDAYDERFFEMIGVFERLYKETYGKEVGMLEDQP
ncbi:MAG: aminoglycoside phosphotransferase family protein [Anaerobacillus sp.]